MKKDDVSAILTIIYGFICLTCVSGCHRTPGPVDVDDFFPSCMRNRSAGITSHANRTWTGSVHFTIYHSKWFQESDVTHCSNSTTECWMGRLNDFISSLSPALTAAKLCVNDFYNAHENETREFELHPTVSPELDSFKCAFVDPADLASKLPSNVSASELAPGDKTLADVNDTVAFIKEDMICSDCSCHDIYENNKYIEEYKTPGTPCGRCWITRFATGLIKSSPLWRPVSEYAVAYGGLERAYRCSRQSIDFDDPSVVPNVLQPNITCLGNGDVEITINSCGLLTFGYEKIDEVAVTSPSTSHMLNASEIDSVCFAQLKQNNGSERHGVFNFQQSQCEPINEAPHTFVYAIRDVEPVFKYPGSLPDMRVHILINFSCSYASSFNVGLDMPITTVARRVEFQLAAKTYSVQITMSAFLDEELTQLMAPENALIQSPDHIWLLLTHDADPSMNLDVAKCWITPISNPEYRRSYEIIENGCPVVKKNGRILAVNFENCQQNSSFGFPSFQWNPDIDSNLLYIYCTVSVGDCEERNCTAARRKRAVVSGTESLSCENPETNCCDHFCFTHSNGDSKCGCNQDYVLGPDGCTCKKGVALSLGPFKAKSTFCSECEACQQICLGCNEEFRAECDCYEGYTIAEDGKSCQLV